HGPAISGARTTLFATEQAPHSRPSRPPVVLKISAVSIPLKVLRLGVYCTGHVIFVSHPRTIYDLARAHRHGGRLAAAPPTTGHHVSPSGKPCPQSATRRSAAATHRYGTPPPRRPRPSARASAPQTACDSRHARHAPALV